MTRKKAVSLVLVMVLALAVLVAPMVATAAVSGTAHLGQAGINLLSVGVTHAVPAVMACEGCTGGGTGPG